MDSFWELVRSSEESSISCSMTLTPIYSPRAYRERDCSHSNLSYGLKTNKSVWYEFGISLIDSWMTGYLERWSNCKD